MPLDLDADEEHNSGRIRRERDRLRKDLERATADVEELRRLLDFHDAITAARPSPPRWMAPKKHARHRATLCVLLSDTHFDEVVNPVEVMGLNAYDRNIATFRLERTFTKVIELARHYVAGVKLDGLVLALGGDIFSGILHDLPEFNEDTLFGSLLYWSEQLTAGISLMAEEFGKVYVPCVVGNHGRLTRKPRTAARARDNADWLLGHMLRRAFADDDRVTIDVPDSADLRFDVYSTRFLLTHGDQTKGGGGIGGIWPPLKRMVAQKGQQYSHDPFDILLCGHWHQLIWGGDFICNGSTKGFDAYAMLARFRPEKPQQALWLVTPEHGITVQAPILCSDRTVEGW